MYSSIIENKEIMACLKSNIESYEANCIVLRAVRKLSYEEQLVIAKGLLFNDKETKSRKNKEEYEANKINRQEKARKNGEELTQCLKCDMKMKKNVLHRHIGNRVCITRQEELYGPLPIIKCVLCNLKVKEYEMDKHENSKKCLDRQELLKELMEE